MCIYTLCTLWVCMNVFLFLCVAPLIVLCWSSTIQSGVKQNRLSSRTFSRPLSHGESLESLDRSRSSPYSTRQTFTSVMKTIKSAIFMFLKAVDHHTCTSSDDVMPLVTSALSEIMCSGKNNCISKKKKRQNITKDVYIC